MFTLFTTTKDFTGQNEINQFNAVRSWTKAPYPVEIFIFGKSSGIEKVETLPGVRIIEEFEKTETGVPLISSMFQLTSKFSSYHICCFVNADILLTERFFNELITIDQLLANKDYLIAGERVDVDINESLDFNDSTWEKLLLEKYKSKFVLHGPLGSDFFAFPKDQYNISNMPPMLVGRSGWDLWMIYNGRKRKLKVIDLSFSTKIIHLNHDYSHLNKKEDIKNHEDEINYSHMPADQKYIYTNLACNYLFKDNSISRNFARGDWLRAFIYYLQLKNGGQLNHFFVRILNRIDSLLRPIRTMRYR